MESAGIAPAGDDSIATNSCTASFLLFLTASEDNMAGTVLGKFLETH